MTTILAVAGLTLLASFLCSLFEAALYSISPSQIELLRDRGARGARRLARMRADIEEPIAAILTINTIAHTVGASWCGAMVGVHYGSTAVGVFAAVFTLLVLALTEIVPKSLGVRYAAQIGPLVAIPLQWMIWSVYPVVWVAKRAMASMVTGGPLGPSEDEIVFLSKLAAQSGGVRPAEHRWVRNALRLDRVTAGDLRTPRTVTETLAADRLVADLGGHAAGWVHSRVPVTDGEHSDRVIGLVHRREVLDAALRRPEENLIVRDHLHPIRFVPESMPAHELLDLFIAERTHMVAVADEYGGFEGVVTLEDVLECLIGEEIVDEHDEVEDMQELALARARRRQAEPGQAELGPQAPPGEGDEPRADANDAR